MQKGFGSIVNMNGQNRLDICGYVYPHIYYGYIWLYLYINGSNLGYSRHMNRFTVNEYTCIYIYTYMRYLSLSLYIYMYMILHNPALGNVFSYRLSESNGYFLTWSLQEKPAFIRTDREAKRLGCAGIEVIQNHPIVSG